MQRLIPTTFVLCGLTVLAVAAALIPPALAAPTVQRVTVGEASYRITLSARPRAGAVRFVIRNRSDDGHDFWLRGGGKTVHSRVVGGGRSVALSAKLRKGVRYTYWCGIGSHRSKGMSGSFVAR